MRVLFLSLLVVLAGCTSVSFEPTSAAGTYPVYEGDVQMLQTFPAEGSYVLLGTIVVSGPEVSRDHSMIDGIKETAADQGANAVVLQTSQIVEANPSDNRRRFAAYAIRLK